MQLSTVVLDCLSLKDVQLLEDSQSQLMVVHRELRSEKQVVLLGPLELIHGTVVRLEPLKPFVSGCFFSCAVVLPDIQVCFS
jgi:hypothetical protein